MKFVALLLYFGVVCQSLANDQVKIRCLNNPDLNQRYQVHTANQTQNGISRSVIAIQDIADDEGSSVLSQQILPRSGTQGYLAIYETQSIKLRTNMSTQRCELEFVLPGSTQPIIQKDMLLD